MNRGARTRFGVGLCACTLLVAACGDKSNDGTTPQGHIGLVPAAKATPLPAPSAGGASFAQRCAQPGVVRCVGFDDAADFNIGAGGINGAYRQNQGVIPPSGTADYSRIMQDPNVRASGASSLRFTVLSSASADVAGSWFTNFSNDLSIRFGEKSEFYVQWRQRFSPELLANPYTANKAPAGFKQIIIGTGDIGYTAGQWYDSCTALETVVVNNQRRGFPQMYNSCTGSASHGPYAPFEEPVGGDDYKLQNARPEPYCLFSQKNAAHFPPGGNCFAYRANEWMTFQVGIKTGRRVKDEFVDSTVTLWVAREGKPSEKVIEWGPWNLTAGPPAEDQRFGKIWLLPYITGKDVDPIYPVAYTWYDELIVSKTLIADP